MRVARTITFISKELGKSCFIVLAYCSLMFRETVRHPRNVFHHNNGQWTFDMTQSSARAPR